MDRAKRDELFYKIADGDEKNVLLLLNEIKDINYKDANGYSYLHIAVQSHMTSVVKYLLEKGADVNSNDRFGKTPLMIAIMHYLSDKPIVQQIIDLLIQYGADLDRAANSGVTARQLAERMNINFY